MARVRPPAGPGEVLGRRALGRATLARQLLLERADRSVPAAVEHLLGLQAQVPGVPYTALWSRLAAFTPEQLAGPLRARGLVRTPTLRTTIHLHTADDALALRPLLQPVLDRTFASTAWGQRLRRAGIDVREVAAAGHAVLVAQPMARAALGAALAQRFDASATDLMWAVPYRVPLVQTTPRGEWGASAAPTWAPTEQWLGRPLTAGAAAQEVLLRYLAAFGPASVRDAQAWSGLTRLRAVADGLGERLRAWHGPGGTDLLDLAEPPPDGRPDPDEPAPVRFLPEYDNALLGYADRSRVVGDDPLVPLLGGPGGAVGTVLVDGLVAATWALRRDAGPVRTEAVLQVRPARGPSDVERDEVVAEGRELLALLTDGAGGDVELGPTAGVVDTR